MDWISLLFGFGGRINRAKYWLAGLVFVCWMIFVAMIVAAFGVRSLAFSLDDIFKVIDPDTYRSLSKADLPLILVKVIGTPLFLWIYVATSIKRLHDLDKSAWWMLPLFVFPGLFEQFSDRIESVYLQLPLGLLAFILLSWCWIELLFFKGSRKTNRFGANPLLPPPPDPPARRDTPRWDQQSEIEMVPHKAGPPPQWRVKPNA